MKKFLISTAGFLALAAIGVFVFREPIFHALEGVITANMFVPDDTDDFDPGVPIGARFPEILALHRGQEITGVDQFIRDKGAVFLAVRSVDW